MFDWWNNLPVFAPEGPGGEGGATAGAGDPPATTGADPAPSARDYLGFDPFEQEPPAAEPPSEPGEEEPGQERAAARAPAENPDADGGDDEVPPQSTQQPDAVTTQLTQIAELLKEANKPKEQPQEAAKPQGPRFNFTVPPEITNGIVSEDAEERRAASTALVNGLANSIYQELMPEVQGMLRRVVELVPKLSQQTVSVAEQQRRAHDDFYSRFSDLPQTQEFKQFVGLVAGSTIQELAQKGQVPPGGWNKNLREEIGKRVYAALGRPVPAENGQAGQHTTTAGRKPKPASFAAGASGSRSGAQTFKSELEKDVLETFGLA